MSQLFIVISGVGEEGSDSLAIDLSDPGIGEGVEKICPPLAVHETLVKAFHFGLDRLEIIIVHPCHYAFGEECGVLRPGVPDGEVFRFRLVCFLGHRQSSVVGPFSRFLSYTFFDLCRAFRKVTGRPCSAISSSLAALRFASMKSASVIRKVFFLFFLLALMVSECVFPFAKILKLHHLSCHADLSCHAC